PSHGGAEGRHSPRNGKNSATIPGTHRKALHRGAAMARAVQRLSRRRALTLGAGALLGTAAAIAQAQQRGDGGRPMDGQVALVTGSTDGLGREVARRLGALGATVLVHGRNAERGAAVVRQIREAGGQAEFYRADFAS